MGSDDQAFMQHALRLAEAQIGHVWPNPSVGAVVVAGGRIVGTGATAPGGRPHAETQALASAGVEARRATLYVSLEPCSHTGHTPPCTDAILAAGIGRVVIACRDADPRVAGIATLQHAGIEVTCGVCETEARALNVGFFTRLRHARPWVALKLATTEDGYMAVPESRWVTGTAARAFGQYLRQKYDAIATGTGTALQDNPALTCRLPGLLDRSPQRVVLGNTTLPPPLALSAPDVWRFSHAPLQETLEQLAQRGVTRLLVEAGPALSTAFLDAGLADRIYWFKTHRRVGAGFSSLPAIDVTRLQHAGPVWSRSFEDSVLLCLQG